MMRIIRICLLTTIACIAISCDDVTKPYTIPGPNGCAYPEPSFTPRTGPVKKVLIEDFTGHYCGNCPQAHTVIDNILSNSTYAGKVVAIAHHSANAGNFTEPWSTIGNPDLKFVYDFRNQISSDIDYKYNGLSYPTGLVNRRSFGGSKLLPHPTWQSHVDEVLAIPQEMDIQLINYYDPSNKTICSYYYTQALTELVGDYKILLFLTEDSIIQWQKSAGTYVPDYIHKHVMRNSFNGLFGTSINEGGVINNGETTINGFSISIENTDWDIDHLSVVAIVYHVASEEIIQAEEVKVLP